MVERCVRDAEVAGSNPVASITQLTDNLKKLLTKVGNYDKISVRHGQLVKRLRRRPLTAETRVRFPYGLLKLNSSGLRFSYEALILRSFCYLMFTFAFVGDILHIALAKAKN